MSNPKLQMMYQPAKKEVLFRRFQNGKEVKIEETSVLAEYMNKKGKFVLQDQGNIFLENIARCFDGEKTILIEVTTTKNDFEDFKQMIEYFNSESQEMKIDTTFLAELPDMDTTYQVIKEHGEKAVCILESNKLKFKEINTKDSPVNVQECVEEFIKVTQNEISNIKEKIASMGENNINLCFAGVFSTGKSKLINAILGKAILPEDISSETARIFRIKSPAAKECVRISFNIGNLYSEIIWDDKSQKLIFSTGPVENEIRKDIQHVINDNSNKPQHHQILCVLQKLNELDDISLEIDVHFPIPLDNNKIQFTIYDTPGTDSNYEKHQRVLEDALSSQTHSILIFVIAPTKLEGEGNNALLKYLNRAEQNDRKTCIDLERSLFVINWADSVNAVAREKLKGESIISKDDPNILPIKLSDKKVFFTSAMYAYAAAAVRNNVDDNGEQREIIEEDYKKILGSQRGKYYMQNHCALSEIATQKQIEESEEALKKALELNDQVEAFHICSGVYALENAILLYGKKYAAAVRAYAIIESVDRALGTMIKSSNTFKDSNQKDIDSLNNQISLLRNELTEKISGKWDEFALKGNEPLPETIRLELHLDREYINNRVEEAKRHIGKFLYKIFFGIFGKAYAKRENKPKINSEVEIILNDYKNTFNKSAIKLLEIEQNKFINEVRSIIMESGGISEDTKTFILNINIPEISISSIDKIVDLYDKQIQDDNIFRIPLIDKDEFLQKLEKELGDMLVSFSQEIESEYRHIHSDILERLKSEYENNIERYSKVLKAMLTDKKKTEELGIKIKIAADELEKCKKELDDKIWRLQSED